MPDLRQGVVTYPETTNEARVCCSADGEVHEENKAVHPQDEQVYHKPCLQQVSQGYLVCVCNVYIKLL